MRVDDTSVGLLSSDRGSVLTTIVVMMGVCAVTVGAVFTTTITYAKNVKKLALQEKAVFLADAGLRAAIVKLNHSSDETISLSESRAYFSETNQFAELEWGFQTRVLGTNGQQMVVSTGVYGTRQAEVTASVALGSGSRSIHALFAHALYAGSDQGNTNYVLRIGGTGSGADFVQGDTYSGNHIELGGDSSLRLPELLHDEEWTEDSDPSHHKKRLNGRYDPAGGFYNKKGKWKTSYKKGGTRYYCTDWPPEAFEDSGDGIYYGGEPYTDQNGVYDVGEEFLDDRNGIYDYGTQAAGSITGMPEPGPGQRSATGGDASVDPPDLAHMYYHVSHDDLEPLDALPRWGNDVMVTAADYGSAVAINDPAYPEHIFLRNPPNSGGYYIWSNGAKIYKRTYTPIYDDSGVRVDDYFLEDPTDSTFNSNPSANRIAQNDSSRTCTMFIDVKAEDNSKLYYVDGNVYLHSPRAYSMRFREPGTRITIVASGNITISDEFYYNADYPDGLQYSDMDSTVVHNPSDALCLIALKDPSCTQNSGNIYIGDRQFGTGGSIHGLLYAENDFVDNNLNTVNQQFISVFGSMCAGNEVRINRQEGGGAYRTRLDVTLDARIRDGEIDIPGLPHALGTQRSIDVDTAWELVPGTWFSWSPLG